MSKVKNPFVPSSRPESYCKKVYESSVVNAVRDRLKLRFVLIKHILKLFFSELTFYYGNEDV